MAKDPFASELEDEIRASVRQAVPQASPAEVALLVEYVIYEFQDRHEPGQNEPDSDRIEQTHIEALQPVIQRLRQENKETPRSNRRRTQRNGGKKK